MRPLAKVAFVVAGIIVVAVGSFAGAGLILFDRYRPQTFAMEPAIPHGSWIWTRPTSNYKRGDIILLEPPALRSPSTGLPQPTLVLARIVAFGGETVDATGGRLRVNGVEAKESYLPSGPIRVGENDRFVIDPKTPDIAPTLVPSGAVYVMDDNRGNSQGSRVYGPVPLANIKQRVVWIGMPNISVLLAVAAALGFLYVAWAHRLWRRVRARRGERES